jgi:hypothetical protein
MEGEGILMLRDLQEYETVLGTEIEQLESKTAPDGGETVLPL